MAFSQHAQQLLTQRATVVIEINKAMIIPKKPKFKKKKKKKNKKKKQKKTNKEKGKKQKKKKKKKLVGNQRNKNIEIDES